MLSLHEWLWRPLEGFLTVRELVRCSRTSKATERAMKQQAGSLLEIAHSRFFGSPRPKLLLALFHLDRGVGRLDHEEVWRKAAKTQTRLSVANACRLQHFNTRRLGDAFLGPVITRKLQELTMLGPPLVRGLRLGERTVALQAISTLVKNRHLTREGLRASAEPRVAEFIHKAIVCQRRLPPAAFEWLSLVIPQTTRGETRQEMVTFALGRCSEWVLCRSKRRFQVITGALEDSTAHGPQDLAVSFELPTPPALFENPHPAMLARLERVVSILPQHWVAPAMYAFRASPAAVAGFVRGQHWRCCALLLAYEAADSALLQAMRDTEVAARDVDRVVSMALCYCQRIRSLSRRDACTRVVACGCQAYTRQRQQFIPTLYALEMVQTLVYMCQQHPGTTLGMLTEPQLLNLQGRLTPTEQTKIFRAALVGAQTDPSCADEYSRRCVAQLHKLLGTAGWEASRTSIDTIVAHGPLDTLKRLGEHPFAHSRPSTVGLCDLPQTLNQGRLALAVHSAIKDPRGEEMIIVALDADSISHNHILAGLVDQWIETAKTGRHAWRLPNPTLPILLGCGSSGPARFVEAVCAGPAELERWSDHTTTLTGHSVRAVVLAVLRVSHEARRLLWTGRRDGRSGALDVECARIVLRGLSLHAFHVETQGESPPCVVTACLLRIPERLRFVAICAEMTTTQDKRVGKMCETLTCLGIQSGVWTREAFGRGLRILCEHPWVHRNVDLPSMVQRLLDFSLLERDASWLQRLLGFLQRGPSAYTHVLPVLRHFHVKV